MRGVFAGAFEGAAMWMGGALRGWPCGWEEPVGVGLVYGRRLKGLAMWMGRAFEGLGHMRMRCADVACGHGACGQGHGGHGHMNFNVFVIGCLL